MADPGEGVQIPLAGSMEQSHAPGAAVSASSFLRNSRFTSPDESFHPFHLAADDPFDWEAYVANFQGRAKIVRLLHMAKVSPELQGPARRLAIETYKTQTLDTVGYLAVLDMHNSAGSARLAEDEAWVIETSAKVKQEGEKLELELRNYQNNLIKESIRMANRDLATHFRKCGKLNEALKCYQRTRDFCSTNEHVMEMCLDVIEVALELGKYEIVLHSVTKAEGVLESYDPAAAAAASITRASGAGASASVSSAAQTTTSAGKGANAMGADAIGALFRAGGSAGTESGHVRVFTGAGRGSDSKQACVQRQILEIESKLKIASALATLGVQRYEHAALLFLTADHEHVDCYSHWLTAADVALYGTLCSLAMFSRTKLKQSVLDRISFRRFMEHEPYTRELLDAFWNCNYRKGLALLEKWKSRHLLDIHLHPHLVILTQLITRRCLQQFFLPFQSVSLSRLSELFGWSHERSRAEVLQLVERKDLKAKLDWVDDIIVADRVEERGQLFQQTMRECTRRVDTAKKLCFRMQLMKNGLTYKESPEQQQPQQQPQERQQKQQSAVVASAVSVSPGISADDDYAV